LLTLRHPRLLQVELLKHIIESKHKLAFVKDARGQGYTKDVLEAMMASTTEGVNLRKVADRLKDKSRWEQKLRDIKGRLFPDGCLHEQEAKKRREEEAERANAVRGANVTNVSVQAYFACIALYYYSTAM
jgi:hypothetical protein